MIKPKFLTRKEEVTAILPIAKSIEVEELHSFAWTVEDEILKPILGDAQFEALKVAYVAYVAANYDESTLNEWQTELLIRVQMVLVKLSIRAWGPYTIANVSSSGWTEAGGDGKKAARETTVERVLDAALQDGNASVESLLAWLDKNRSQYPDWVSSPAFTAAFDSYINNATDFNNYFNIGESRYTFLRIAPQRNEAVKIVDRIIWELGPELITQQREKSLTDPNKDLLDLVKKAVANMAMSDALLSMSFQVGEYGVTVMASATTNRDAVRAKTPVGDNKLAQLQTKALTDAKAAFEEIKDLIYSNIDLYPTFKNGAHYKPEAPAPERYVGKSTDKILMM